MSWLDDIMFAPIKWALPDELEKKLNPVFDVVGAVGNAALQKWDSAAADAVKIAADSCELAGKKDAAKVLGKVAEGVELVGGGILKASDGALAAKAKAIKEGVPQAVSREAADAAVSKTLETVVARVAVTQMGAGVGGALGGREGAEAGLTTGFGIGANLGAKEYARAAAGALGAGAGIVVGDKLAAKDDPKGPRKFNYRAFGAVNGLATGTVGIGQAVAGKDVRAAVEGAAGVTKNALNLKAESDRAHGARPDKVLAKAIEAAGGVETAVGAIKTMNETVARFKENRRNDALIETHPNDLDDKERGA